MEQSSQIKYKYALDANGKLVDIKDVPMAYSERQTYYSLDEGDEMIARKGHQLAWHFAHKDGREGSEETYLHELAKRRFKEEFEKDGPFYISLPTRAKCPYYDDCTIADSTKCITTEGLQHDLKAYYAECQLEKTVKQDDNTFRPDVLLIPRNPAHPKVFIEIFVTHPSTKEKLESGAKIIEIKIESTTDIDRFSKRSLSETKKVKFYGFSPKNITARERVTAFYVDHYYLDTKGEIHFDEGRCQFMRNDGEWPRKDVQYAIYTPRIDQYDNQVFRKFCLQKTFDHGLKIWNCNVCRHLSEMRPGHKYADRETACGLFRELNIGKTESPTRALRCPRFELNPDITSSNEIVKEYCHYNETFPERGKIDSIVEEDYEGLNTLESMISSYSFDENAESDYWEQINDLIYQDSHGVSHYDIGQALYVAEQRKKYIVIHLHHSYHSGGYSYGWRQTNTEYTISLVDTIPARVVED